MSLTPDPQMRSLPMLLIGVFLVGILLLFVFSTSGGTVLLGGLLLLLLILAVYYVGVRIDRKLRGG